MRMRREYRCKRGGLCDLYVLDLARDYCRNCRRIVRLTSKRKETK